MSVSVLGWLALIGALLALLSVDLFFAHRSAASLRGAAGHPQHDEPEGHADGEPQGAPARGRAQRSGRAMGEEQVEGEERGERADQ